MDINRNSPIPLHYQLKNILEEDIKAGMWGTEDFFPTDKELMQKYDLSSTTVRRALSELAHEGWLERKPGKGTFIRRAAIEETLGRLTGFFEEMSSQGFIPSAEILRTEPITITSKELIEYPQLRVFNGQDMYLIEKIQHIDGKPIVYLASFWPYIYGKTIAEHDLEHEGIYQVLEREFRISPTKADQTIYAGAASRHIAKLLEVKTGYPVLIMERVAYAEEQPIEFSYNIYRSDQYKYNVTLYHNSNNIGGVWGDRK